MRACPRAVGYAGHTRGEREGVRHYPANTTSPLKWSIYPIPVPRDKFFSGPERDQLDTEVGARGGTGSPTHQRVGAASRPRAPSHRVPYFPTGGASQACNLELFECFAFLVSVGVVAASLRHAAHLLRSEHGIPSLSDGAIGTTFSAPSYNTPFFWRPSLVEVSYPGGGTRVPCLLSSWGRRLFAHQLFPGETFFCIGGIKIHGL